MQKNLNSSSKKNGNQRGVAVIFSLGILGLLTVMALGFASTALLNNSLSKNAMNSAYARSLAKNLALTQALYIIRQKEIDSDGGFLDYRKIYTWGTDANSVNHKDFLWKLDYSDSGVQIYKYEPDKTASNPANEVRWQYVKDSSNKLIGRYAYVVIPDKGRIDPSVNIGQLASKASESPASQPPLFSSTATEDDLKKQQTFISPVSGSNKCYTAFNNFRWMTFRELIRKAELSNAFYMFQYHGVAPSLTMKSPEAFEKDGILYSRFNMTRTDWNTMTAKQLCGIKNDDSYETLAEFPDEQTFIPWLQDMCKKSDALKTQALQIAANIIQYNRDEGQPTVTDKPGAVDSTWTWLTDPPAYAGIGKHPMLNEIGFLIRVKTEVTSEFIKKDDEAHTITYKYTPIYYITVDAGAELIYTFGPAPAGGMPDSEIRFSGTKSGDVNNMILKFKLRKFLQNGSTELTNTVSTLGNNLIDSEGVLNPKMIHNHIDEMVIGSDGELTKLVTSSTTPVKMDDAGAGLKWSNFNLTLKAADWNASPAYTKSNKFWKEQQTNFQQTLRIPIRSFEMTTNTSVGTVEKISTAIARRMTIEWEQFTPGHAVMKYDGKQRDLVLSLKAQTLPSNNYGKDYDNNDIHGWSGMDKDTEKVWFVAYEVTDPLFNYKGASWKDSPSELKNWSETTSLTADYPGTLYDGSTESHTNSPVKEIIANTEDPIFKLWSSYGWTAGKDPIAYNSDFRMPTNIIRHGQMRSFWEFGCISRGESWKTLNLLKKDNSSAPDFSYNKGDAVLFDQLKFTDEDYTTGKINLNTDVHQVLEKIFNSGLIDYKDILGTGTTSATNLFQAGSAPDEGSNPVKITAQTLNTSGLPDGPHADCLACILTNNITKTYNLKNRGDLLSEWSSLPTDTGESKPAEASWNTMQNLLKEGSNDLEKLQIVAKLMPLLRTVPVDSLRVVILAQSIRDAGENIPVLVDWDGTGIETAVSSSEDANKKKAMYKAGYRRAINGNAITGLTEPALSKTITTSSTRGTYDLGADKITGESRLVATLVRDPVKKTWKLVRLQYVE